MLDADTGNLVVACFDEEFEGGTKDRFALNLSYIFLVSGLAAGGGIAGVPWWKSASHFPSRLTQMVE